MRSIQIKFNLAPMKHSNWVQLAKDRVDQLSQVINDERNLFRMIWSDHKFARFSKNFSIQDWNEFNKSEQGIKVKTVNYKFNVQLVH